LRIDLRPRVPRAGNCELVDIRDPAAPRLATRFEVPSLLAGGGWGYFPMAGCSIDLGWGWYGGGYYGGYYGNSLALTDGDLVVSQHVEPLNDGSGRARYYLDRLDVSNPDAPRVLPKINIPGTPIHFNAETGELITLDYNNSIEPGKDWNECTVRGAYAYFDDTIDACRVTRRTLNALLVSNDRAVRTSQLSLDQTRRLGNIAVSDSRVFFTTTDFPPVVDSYGVATGTATAGSSDSTTVSSSSAAPTPLSPVTLETLRLENGQLVRLPSTDLREVPSNGWYGGQLFARDQRVFEIYDNRVTVVDTTDGMKPATLTHEIPGYGCGSLEVAADSAYCALGQRGVEVIDMSSMR
jgi:hypothetical protein